MGSLCFMPKEKKRPPVFFSVFAISLERDQVEPPVSSLRFFAVDSPSASMRPCFEFPVLPYRGVPENSSCSFVAGFALRPFSQSGLFRPFYGPPGPISDTVVSPARILLMPSCRRVTIPSLPPPAFISSEDVFSLNHLSYPAGHREKLEDADPSQGSRYWRTLGAAFAL